MKEEWLPLLDSDMSKREVYLSNRHKDGYNADMPKKEDGSIIAPIGYNKVMIKAFTIVEEKSEPVLKVSGKIYGCAFTKQRTTT